MWRAQSKAILLYGLMVALAQTVGAGPAAAATVPDLYVAQVPAAALSGPALDEAFALALDQVLVKVTGLRGIAADPARRRAVGPAAPLVRQYQPVPGGQIRVSFDPTALRGRLDAANLPVWADERPVTYVVLPAEPGLAPQDLAGGVAQTVAGPERSYRQLFLATAASRGLPVQLATEPEVAERAAGSNLLLTGKPLPASGLAMLNWTLAWDGDGAQWQGDAVEGAHGLADRLTARYATAASSGRVLRLKITGVDSFDAYGRLQAYLRTLGLIRSAELKEVTGGQLVYEVGVRGDVAQLNDAFALSRVLEPVVDAAAGDLVYRLVTGP